MQHKIFTVTLLIFIFFPLFSSAEKKTGFVSDQLKQLEQEVRAEQSIEFIAKCLSDTDFANWTEEVSHRTKLYVAIMWIDQKNYQAAAGLLDTLDPLGEYSDLWMYFRATLLVYMGYGKESLPVITRLEGRFPSDVDVLYLKSLYLAETGDLTETLKLLGAILKKNKKDGKIYLQRGAVHMLAFDYDPAINDFKMALKYLSKDDIYARQQTSLQIGLICWKIKMQQAEGRRYLEQGMALDPDSEMVRQVRQSLEAWGGI
ncbi:MAG: hypothetical protein HQM16_11900 [Deltaproteobacteria bacterium]|nr:hypothetical protein [Deltaproteobacteria bacterium]